MKDERILDKDTAITEENEALDNDTKSVPGQENVGELPISAEEIEISAEELTDLLDEKKYVDARLIAESIPSIDLAELFLDLEPKHRTLLFRLLKKEMAAEAFVEMDSELQESLIQTFTDKELTDVLDEMYIDDTVDLIEEMPASVVKRIIHFSDKDDREAINKILRYDRDSAGAIMTTEYVRLTPNMTVTEALAHIKHVAIDKETIYTCYVTDKNRRLLGIVTAKSLLISNSDDTMADIMNENVIFVNTGDDRESVALMFDKYGFIALPVVDSECRLVGIVTVDDAIDVLRSETEEDFAKMAGITPSERTYTKTSAFQLWKARIPWLLLLMVSAVLSSTILSGFEAALPAVMILFVPMLMDTGGNSGEQSSVTVIRAISLDEIHFKDLFRVMWKELRVGIYVGLTLSVVAFLKVMLVDRWLMNNPDVTIYVAFAVAITLCLTIMVSKLIGASLPILAKKLKLDPAVMAAPFITTIVDAVSLLLYFAIANYAFGL